MRHHLVEQIKIENEMIDEFAGRNEGKIEAEEQAKVAFASDGIDPATASAKMNAIVVATFQAMSHRVSHAMVRIQRIWRQRFMWRAQRTSNRRHVATINLQRWIRGYYGRVLYGLYKRVAHMAAGKIQSHFRALMDYRLIQAYKALVVIVAKGSAYPWFPRKELSGLDHSEWHRSDGDPTHHSRLFGTTTAENPEA